jgi:hypothetical protein
MKELYGKIVSDNTLWAKFAELWVTPRWFFPEFAFKH